jgi:hypothetical protein
MRNAHIVVVRGYETITVPAGTFSCYRVEASRTYVNRTYTSNMHRSTRWYCPEVKWIAKEIVETTTRSTSNPASNGTTTDASELVRFTAGNR